MSSPLACLDLLLAVATPQACVQRVIKAVLPDNVQIGKDAKAAFSRSAGIFIMYVRNSLPS